MKKYLPISTILVAFFSLVLFRDFRPSDDDNPVVGSNNSQSEQTGTLSPMPSPVRQVESVTPVNTANTTKTGVYRDGSFSGTVEDAYYGNYQVAAVISNGRITDINFLQYPNDNRTSRSINSQAMVYLKAEAIQAQSAQVDIVSGASSSSAAFVRSLSSALKKASQ